MNRLQFRVLYRQFLFRVVDLELLSHQAQGDASKLLGQFAALLVLIGIVFAGTLLHLDNSRLSRDAFLVSAWPVEYFLIATTMLIAGVLSVLTWDSIFPDKRDVFVLCPLPVQPFCLFMAKASAVATAFLVATAALHTLASLLWLLVWAPRTSTPLDLMLSPDAYRAFAAYWVTMIFAAWFVFGSLLCVQGLTAQILPRRYFLLLSPLLQMAVFCILIASYFLLPPLATPAALSAPGNQVLLAAWPTYWFLGLFQRLSGSMHQAVAPLAKRTEIALAVVLALNVILFLFSYRGALRKIAEESDLRPLHVGNWLPKFRHAFDTAVVQFAARTLLRSRQHRMMLAFYLGLAFAINILFLRPPEARQQFAGLSAGHATAAGSGPLLVSAIVIMTAWIVGVRVVFSMPVDVRANWIFRLMPLPGGRECLRARRRSLAFLALAPSLLALAAIFLFLWSWTLAVGHLAVLCLLGVTIAECCLLGMLSIPFTHPWLPGRSNLHLTFWLCVNLLMLLVSHGVQYEQQALESRGHYITLLLTLAAIAIITRLRTERQANLGITEIQFEHASSAVIQGLDLHRDGVLTIDMKT